MSRLFSLWRSSKLQSELCQVWRRLGTPQKSTWKTEWAWLKMHKGSWTRTSKYWFWPPQFYSPASYPDEMAVFSNQCLGWWGTHSLALSPDSNSENLGCTVKRRSPGHPSQIKPVKPEAYPGAWVLWNRLCRCLKGQNDGKLGNAVQPSIHGSPHSCLKTASGQSEWTLLSIEWRMEELQSFKELTTQMQTQAIKGLGDDSSVKCLPHMQEEPRINVNKF